jgi:hypothetical protein
VSNSLCRTSFFVIISRNDAEVEVKNDLLTGLLRLIGIISYELLFEYGLHLVDKVILQEIWKGIGPHYFVKFDQSINSLILRIMLLPHNLLDHVHFEKHTMNQGHDSRSVLMALDNLLLYYLSPTVFLNLPHVILFINFSLGRWLTPDISAIPRQLSEPQLPEILL